MAKSMSTPGKPRTRTSPLVHSGQRAQIWEVDRGAVSAINPGQGVSGQNQVVEGWSGPSVHYPAIHLKASRYWAKRQKRMFKAEVFTQPSDQSSGSVLLRKPRVPVHHHGQGRRRRRSIVLFKFERPTEPHLEP